MLLGFDGKTGNPIYLVQSGGDNNAVYAHTSVVVLDISKAAMRSP